VKRTGLYLAMLVGSLAAAHLSCGQTPPATAPTTPATAAVDPQADKALDLLQKRDGTLTDFTSKIRYQVIHGRTGDAETSTGTFDYIKGAADRKFAVQFDQSSVDEGKPRPIDQKIVFDGQWSIIRDVQKMLFVKEQLAPPGKPYDPFKLGQGPFPIPIGQDKQDMLREFTVTVEPANATPTADPVPDPKPDPKAPATLVHLKLIPRNPKGFNFKEAHIWVSKEAELPVQVSLVDKDENVTTIELTDIKINTGTVKMPELQEPAAGAGWRIEVKPYGGGGPAAPATPK